ncbi:MAG: hypothetical protein BYD32DRAFT_442173 [Podila humilis]|nr:MAG: hypothetical protein BYD32DRAFT_442173 [Podila humilis]
MHTPPPPRLWFSVFINGGQKLKRFLTTEAQLAFSRNVGLIRVLYLRLESVCNIFAPLNARSSEHEMDQMRIALALTADCRFVIRDEPLSEELQTALFALMRRNPGLKNLEIVDVMSHPTLLQLLTHDLPHLTVLYLSPRCCIDQYLAQVLLRYLPEGIRHIRISTSAIPTLEYLRTKFESVWEYSHLGHTPFLSICASIGLSEPLRIF